VTGLVFALAGYLVYDVHKAAPFMLLDSLEAIDSERIAKLVEYFADYGQYLVVVLLPEDDRALDSSYDRIEMDTPRDRRVHAGVAARQHALRRPTGRTGLSSTKRSVLPDARE
jgi:hypothetical protein